MILRFGFSMLGLVSLWVFSSPANLTRIGNDTALTPDLECPIWYAFCGNLWNCSHAGCKREAGKCYYCSCEEQKTIPQLNVLGAVVIGYYFNESVCLESCESKVCSPCHRSLYPMKHTRCNTCCFAAKPRGYNDIGAEREPPDLIIVEKSIMATRLASTSNSPDGEKAGRKGKKQSYNFVVIVTVTAFSLSVGVMWLFLKCCRWWYTSNSSGNQSGFFPVATSEPVPSPPGAPRQQPMNPHQLEPTQPQPAPAGQTLVVPKPEYLDGEPPPSYDDVVYGFRS